jgi:hypothetical protein
MFELRSLPLLSDAVVTFLSSVVLLTPDGHSYNTTNKMLLLSQIIYSCKTLYMFRTGFPSIIRSSKLRIQQRDIPYCCICFVQFSFNVSMLICVFCLFGTEKYNIHRSMHHNIVLQYNQQDAPLISNYLFLWNALHVSDGLSVHHQLLLPATSSSCLTYTVAVYAVLSSWWWTERPSETC